MTKLILKPEVYKCQDGTWAARLDYISWEDISYYETWEDALEGALWKGLCAGVWS